MRYREAIIMALVAGTVMFPPLLVGLLFFIYMLDRHDSELMEEVEETYHRIIKRDKDVTEPTYKPLYNLSAKKKYLRSPEWNVVRKRRLSIDNYTCQGCGTEDEALEVHHINYDTLYHEDINSLRSLCRGCHQATHDKHGYIGNHFPVTSKFELNI